MSAAETMVGVSSWRFRFVDFLVRMWLLKAFERLTLPVPVTFRRLAAPRCVFILGILAPSPHVLRGLVQELLEGDRPQIAFLPGADGHRARSRLPVPQDQHVGN